MNLGSFFKISLKWYLRNYNESNNGWLEFRQRLSFRFNENLFSKTCCFLPMKVNTINLNNIMKQTYHWVFIKTHSFYTTIEWEYFKTKEDAFNDYAFFKEKHVYEIAAKYKGIQNRKHI
jgi:hypothetical protein